MARPLNQPQLIDDRYQIVRLLGEGGMGAVYEARHVGTGRRVAVKVIIGNHVKTGDVVARFQREARAAGSIETQHIVQVLDTGVDHASQNPYMVMEFLQGEDIQQCIKRVGPLEPEIALRIIAQACVGLQKAHEAGVIHRDIKPANLYLAVQDHGVIMVKLLDFGIAKVNVDQVGSVEDAGLTRTGSMLGSPLYMSPEQAKGAKSTDQRTDIWSLGVVLYEMLAGETPYSHCESLGALILEICSSSARPIQELAPWVPPEAAAIVHRALTIDVNRRYASVADLLAEVRQLLPGGTALEHSMLAPLTQQRRSFVAPKLSGTATGLSASSAGSGVVTARSGDYGVPSGSPTADIAGGLASSQVGTSSGSKLLPMVLGGVLVLGGGGLAAYRLTKAPAAPAVSAEANASALPAAPAAPAPLATERIIEIRSVQLAVVPATVIAEIDGVTAPVSNGMITLTGASGSVHQVRLRSGENEVTNNVVISEAGAVPNKLELSLKPAAAVVPGAKPSRAAAPGGAAPAAATAPSPPAAPKPAAAAPAAPTNPGVDRSFQ